MVAKTSRNSSESAAPGAEATRLPKQKNGGLVNVSCTITGITPLLLNAMPRDVLLSIYTKKKTAKTAERDDPADVAASHVHRLANGDPCVPPRMLYASLIAAGIFIRLDGKRQVSTKSETNLPGLLMLSSVELPLTVPGSSDPASWEVDIQQGRNPNGGEAVCIIRPCFYKWELRPEFQVDTSVFAIESARQLVELAGRRCGIGDFRPNRKGTFGQFAITLWDVQD